jgi:arsenite-transporting ATPase
MITQPRRLYIFTGKGGVGKTTLSKAFVQYFKKNNQEAIYLTFRNQAIGDKSVGNSEVMKNGIKEIYLDLEECAKDYIEKKLNSKLVGSWIVKTPFFKSLVNMVPGFSYVIYMGRILEMGKADPNLIIVLDAPASGHALTMVESTTNFQQIFGSGVIFDDTAKMLSKLNDPTYTKINVISLASVMSWQEAVELKTGLNERTPVQVDIIVNNALAPLLEGNTDELPVGIREKILNEKSLLEEHASEMRCVLNHSLGTNYAAIESDLVGSLSKLIYNNVTFKVTRT